MWLCEPCLSQKVNLITKAIIRRTRTVAFGALAANDAILGNAPVVPDTQENGIRISKVKFCATLEGKTVDEGPMLWGYSIDLTAAEVEESLEATPSGPKDVAGLEQANRKVFPMGFVCKNSVADGAPRGRAQFQEIEHFPWKDIPEGSTLDLWGYNEGAALTTGAQLVVHTELFGVWLND